MNSKSLKSLFFLWKNISKKYQILFGFVCALSIIAAILEALVIITFIPFITNIAGDVDTSSMQVGNAFNIINFLNFENRSIAFITFILVIFFSSATRLFYIFLTAKTSAKIGSYLSKKIYNIIDKIIY